MTVSKKDAQKPCDECYRWSIERGCMLGQEPTDQGTCVNFVSVENPEPDYYTEGAPDEIYYRMKRKGEITT